MRLPCQLFFLKIQEKVTVHTHKCDAFSVVLQTIFPFSRSHATFNVRIVVSHLYNQHESTFPERGNMK